MLEGNWTLLAVSLIGLWQQWIQPILLLVFGLGAVIFFHELGHFLLAKAVGIQVERFALGFGWRLFGIQIGETDYCVNLLPLGGYVKMLGQEDIRPLPDEQRDPRAFNNKSVGARLAVISAGVVMNVILAALLFIVVCLAGIQFQAPVVGAVHAGYPAATAEIAWQDDLAAPTLPAAAPASRAAPERGLQPGDRVLAIDGKAVTRFSTLMIKSALANKDSTFTMRIEREENGQKRIGTTVVGVKRRETDSGGELFAFGIEQAPSVIFGRTNGLRGDNRFEEDDRIVAINGNEVRDFRDVLAAQENLDGPDVRVTVDRAGKEVDVVVSPVLQGGKLGDVVVQDQTRTYGRIIAEDDEQVRLRLENEQEKTFPLAKVGIGKDEVLDILGMIPRLKITGVVEGSPAEKAGLKHGDIVLAYGDHETPGHRKFLEINKKVAGSGTTIVVQRDTGGEGRYFESMWIEPADRNERIQIGVTQGADQEHAVVGTVRPGSPAERAGIRPGAAITKVNGQPVRTWIDVFNALKASAGKEVALTYELGTITRAAEIGTLDKTIFDEADYSFTMLIGPRGFKPLMGPLVKKDPLAAIPWGVQEASHFILMTYAMLHNFMQGNISHKEFSGPVGIGGIAIKVGRESLVQFLYFLAMISVSLAVVNFLPVPVVDGGHAVFLLIEKIRRKPVPVKVQNIAQMVGLAAIVFVFVALTWQDISRMLKDLW